MAASFSRSSWNSRSLTERRSESHVSGSRAVRHVRYPRHEHQRTRLRTRAADVHAVPHASSACRGIMELAELALRAEADLQDMFEPGRPMPKASQVARMRERVSQLKSQLSQQLDQLPDAAGGDAGDEYAREEAVAKARLVLYGAQNGSVPAHSREAYELELAVLEAENEFLRDEAQVLLMRQALLEELALQHGLRTSGTRQLQEEPASEEREHGKAQTLRER